MRGPRIDRAHNYILSLSIGSNVIKSNRKKYNSIRISPPLPQSIEHFIG